MQSIKIFSILDVRSRVLCVFQLKLYCPERAFHGDSPNKPADLRRRLAKRDSPNIDANFALQKI
ncbi:MAG: hypothetical protein ACRCUY_09450 [Thermoguttaceae bacterium]